MQLPDEAVNIMESFHARMAKTFQGLPDQASNIGAVAGLELSISAFSILILILRTLCFGENSQSSLLK